MKALDEDRLCPGAINGQRKGGTGVTSRAAKPLMQTGLHCEYSVQVPGPHKDGKNAIPITATV
jgi:hypothetical protein